jgi:alkylation response protein AidB-like acyl-CoA dehydrogenase
MRTVAAKAREWLGRARDLEPVSAEFRDIGEQERRLPAPLFEAVRDAGIFRMLRPRLLGGEEPDLETVLGVIEELARQDGSLGWNVMIGSLGGLFPDYLGEAAACEIFGDRDAVSAGSFAPNGQAVEVTGGYRATGRWSFASGCQNASWLV